METSVRFRFMRRRGVDFRGFGGVYRVQILKDLAGVWM